MSVPLHPAVNAVRSALDAAGVGGRVRELSDSARTAALAAATLSAETARPVDIGQIVNSLIFDADGAPLLVLTSGAHRVDTERVAAATGSTAVRRAGADFVKKHTGQVIGGVAPVGHPQRIRTLVDVWLERYDEVWAAAGHSHQVFPTTYSELLAMTGGEPVDVE